MGAPVRVSFEDVRAAVSNVRAAGVEVAYRNGRVTGLRAIRQCAGGDADRVRSAVIIILAEEGQRVGAAELRAARAILQADVRGRRSARRGGGMTGQRALDVLEGLAQCLMAVGSSMAAIGPMQAGVPEHNQVPDHDPCQKTTLESGQPAGRLLGAAMNGARQKPDVLHVLGHGPLAAMRALRMGQDLRGVDTFDPFDLEAVARRRAAAPRDGSDDHEAS